MPSKHTCWLLQAFLSADTRAALTSQSEHTFSGFMLQCNCSLCKGTSLEFAHRSVTAYCALIQCEDILYKMTWSILWYPKAVHYQHWGHYSDHPDAPPHMQCWSISSPHLCTADQSVHTTFASLINRFTLHGFWDLLKCPLWFQVITNLSTTPNKTTTKNANDCYHSKTRSKHKKERSLSGQSTCEFLGKPSCSVLS